MEKAYDLKDLGDRLKKRGLHEGEDAVRGALNDIITWFKESAALTSNPVDDLGALGLDQLKPFVIPYIDKIDGEIQG